MKNVPWAEDNNQLHQLTSHGHFFINDPRIRSLGILTLEGLEGGNFFFNKEKALHTFKGDIMIQLKQLLQIEIINTSPTLHRQFLFKKKVKCSKCGNFGHTAKNKSCLALGEVD